jgi:hypothetical protein
MEFMTNITLSIDDKIYKKMKQYSEIKWSEFVRKAIKQRIEELESIRKSETYTAMLMSQDVLAREWDNEYDEWWNDV